MSDLKCSIIARVQESEESEARTAAPMRPKASESKVAPHLSFLDDNVLIPGTVKQGSYLSISAPEDINNVSAYDLSGNCLGSCKGTGSSFSVPISVFAISRSGIYVIHVETAGGVVAKKIVVK